MVELLRVYNKKTIMLFSLLLVASISIFIFGANPNKEITLTGDELEQYINGYPYFLDKTVKQGKLRSQLKLYEEGYASEVTAKSKTMYESLIGTEPEAGENRGMVLFFQSHIPELLALFFMLHVVSSFFDERKKGLVHMVRATYKGRSILCIYRIGILFFTAFVSVLLLMGANLVGAALTFGTGDLFRPIQSLPEYQKCPYGFSIIGFVLILVVVKTMGVFLMGLIMYVLRGLVNDFLFYCVIGGLIIAEILTGIFIPPVSSLNTFKYINLYSLIKTDDFFSGSVYLNLFDHAVRALSVLCIITVILSVLLLLAGFLIFGRKYAVRNKGGERLGGLIRRIKERFALQRTLLGWESYKVFIRQGAFIFIILCLGLHIQQSSKYGYFYGADPDERLNYKKYSGEIDDSKMERAERWMAQLKQSEANYVKRLEDLEADGKFGSDSYMKYSEALSQNRANQKAFEPVLMDLRSANEYRLRTGNSVSLVEPYVYDVLLNRDTQTRERGAFLAIVAIIGALAGIFAFEKHTNMEQMINSTYRGRRVKQLIKPLIVGVTAFLCPVILSLVQMILINKSMQFPDMDAPVQGLRYLNDFGLYVSIKTFFALLLVIRGLFGVIIGTVTAFISHMGDDKFSVICRVTIIMVIWIFVAELVPGLDFLNPIKLLGYTWV
ncbi:MAG: hypothetical protein K6E47_16360 [Lachnospiraceae bacterium]|nr:hypothetical protein [Lachnospiraceae bacterium]